MLYISNSNKKLTIAIDGYAACGKSTLAKDLAQKLNYTYVNTGAMYRAVTLYFLQKKIDYTNLTAIQQALPNIHIQFMNNETTCSTETYLNDVCVEKAIRDRAVSDKVSEISKVGLVRQFLVAQQRAYGKNGGIIMEGRDIGTVVFPDADLKIFVTASLKARVQRRYLQLKRKGMEQSLTIIQQNLNMRDHIDTTRAESPLRKAAGAFELDNTHLTRLEQLQQVMIWVKKTETKIVCC